jgi:hypothetical protein
MHAHQVLDSLRSTYCHLDDELAQVAKEILEQAPLLSHVSVEYLPQIGYLIAIQEQEQHFLPVSAAPTQSPAWGHEHDGDPQQSFFTSQHHCQDTDFDFRERLQTAQAQPHPPSQEGVFPPEYQHIYSSEGTTQSIPLHCFFFRVHIYHEFHLFININKTCT